MTNSIPYQFIKFFITNLNFIHPCIHSSSVPPFALILVYPLYVHIPPTCLCSYSSGESSTCEGLTEGWDIIKRRVVGYILESNYCPPHLHSLNDSLSLPYLHYILSPHHQSLSEITHTSHHVFTPLRKFMRIFISESFGNLWDEGRVLGVGGWRRGRAGNG